MSRPFVLIFTRGCGMDLALMKQLAIKNDTKIVLLVVDGLGGLPSPRNSRNGLGGLPSPRNGRNGGRTELQAAKIPNLDRLAAESACGLTRPIATGITPGSEHGHLALFGYDPLQYMVGRGVMEATGIEFDLQQHDVAARANFCTVDQQHRIVDRRAGRISTETCAALCQQLRTIELDPSIEIFVEPVAEHRFLLVLRGEGLDHRLTETDPQREGLEALPATALVVEAETTAKLINRFVRAARGVLTKRDRANMIILRGFSSPDALPQIQDVYKLRAAAIASYPMYRGLAKLVGMTPLGTGPELRDEVQTLRAHWDNFDFFFLHYKAPDTFGEDGDFDGKVGALEELDKVIPDVLQLEPSVLMVAGDHSTPSLLKGHSWHPVPFLLHSEECWKDGIRGFNEVECRRGSLQTINATEVMPLALAHAKRLAKYDARPVGDEEDFVRAAAPR